MAWIAGIPGSADKYLALFNLRDRDGSSATGAPVAIPPAAAGFPKGCRIRDLWRRMDLGYSAGEFSPVIPWHGAGLYRFSIQ
jgi:hypothetical protein